MKMVRELHYFVHETACVDQPCEIGPGTKIWHFTHIMAHASIGSGCNIGQNVFIGTGVRIGNNVKIQNNVSVYEGVVLEDDVFCGPSMVFTNVRTPRSAVPRNRPNDFIKTFVRRGATIGANATIICGSTIGEFSFVGAGSVVTKDVPAHNVVFGNPARVQGYACECGGMLQFEADSAQCLTCEQVWVKTSDTICKATLL